MTVAFFVRGEPQPQGNKTPFIRGGKVVLVEGRRPASRDAFQAWRAAVVAGAQAAAKTYPDAPLDDALCIECRFIVPRPKSVKRPLPIVAPDGDKLMRAVWDALKIGGLIGDDALFVDWHGSKRYADRVGEAGAHIIVTRHKEKEAPMPASKYIPPRPTRRPR